MAAFTRPIRDLVHEDADPPGEPRLLTLDEQHASPAPRLALRPAPLVRGLVRGAAQPVVTIQRGHCFRRTGATGTRREQEAANAIGSAAADKLRGLGYRVHLIGADDAIPGSDFFVALHTDGSGSKTRRGASVGWRDAAGREYAAAWKRAHQACGYPAGFHPDNYTPNLAGYYGIRKSRARFRFIAEHGFTTNPLDEAYIFDNIGACAQAHVDAIGAIRGGHPLAPPPPVRPPTLPVAAPPFPLPRGSYFGPEGGPRGSVSGYHSNREHLRYWQQRMRDRGWDITPDGLYGRKGDRIPQGQTADVARAFQRRKGLVADGLIGPATWDAAWTAPLT